MKLRRRHLLGSPLFYLNLSLTNFNKNHSFYHDSLSFTYYPCVIFSLFLLHVCANVFVPITYMPRSDLSPHNFNYVYKIVRRLIVDGKRISMRGFTDFNSVCNIIPRFQILGTLFGPISTPKNKNGCLFSGRH